MVIVFPFLLLGLGSIVIAIMTAVSASRFPDWAFQQTGTSKFVWVGLPLIFLLLCGYAGGVMGLIWFSSKKSAVEAAARAGGPTPYGYGAPPYGYGYGAPPGSPPPPSTGTWGAPQAPGPQPPGPQSGGWQPPPPPPPSSPPPPPVPPSGPPQ